MRLTAQQINKLDGFHRNTLLNWEKQGLLKPHGTPGGRRRYRKEEIEKVFSRRNLSPRSSSLARVSTKKREAYLKNQIDRLVEFARSKGWHYQVVSEIASGVNENRRGLSKLLNMVRRGKVSKVIIEYRDRLARFGYE